MAKLKQIHAGIARHRAVHGPMSLERSSVIPEHMRAMQETWAKEDYKGAMLWATTCMCFFGCLRAREALAPDKGGFDPGANLTFEDVVAWIDWKNRGWRKKESRS